MRGSETLNRRTGFPVFAFRLHQFFSRGDTVDASLDAERRRGTSRPAASSSSPDRPRPRAAAAGVLPRVRPGVLRRPSQRDRRAASVLEPREIADRLTTEGQRNGYLYVSDENPWPTTSAEQLDACCPTTGSRARAARASSASQPQDLPQHVTVVDRTAALRRRRADGASSSRRRSGSASRCGVAYGSRQTADFGKLATLGAGGRSTATTILGLSAVRELRADDDACARGAQAAELHRQPPGRLAAGRALQRLRRGRPAARGAVPGGRRAPAHDGLAPRRARRSASSTRSALPLERYADDPDVKVRRATRDRAGAARRARLPRSTATCERGWRVTSPNLEQTGLLEIDYDVARRAVRRRGRLGRTATPALGDGRRPTRPRQIATGRAGAARLPAPRARDQGRRTSTPTARRSSSSRSSPAADRAVGDRRERAARPTAACAYPRSRAGTDDSRCDVRLAREWLRPVPCAGAARSRCSASVSSSTSAERIIGGILEALRRYGLVEQVADSGDDGVAGYQIPAAAAALAGGRRHGDRATTRSACRVRPPSGRRTNPFFVDLYRDDGAQRAGHRGARAHRAGAAPRSARSARSASARRSCRSSSARRRWSSASTSPTLNVVNLRNVPPTPANYAQRSGRAGRSGQPALVFTYCASGQQPRPVLLPPARSGWSPARSRRRGSTSPTRTSSAPTSTPSGSPRPASRLGRSLTDVLDVDGDDPTLELQPVGPTRSIESGRVAPRAHARARGASSTRSAATSQTRRLVDDELARRRPRTRADRASTTPATAGATSTARRCADERHADRRHHATHRRAMPAKNEAERLRREAEAQLELLRGEGSGNCSSPTSTATATSPARASCPATASRGCRCRRSSPAGAARQRPTTSSSSARGSSRSREFGPRSIVYHEGARYLINQVILPVDRDPDGDGLPTERAKRVRRLRLPPPDRRRRRDRTSASAAAPLLDAPLTRSSAPAERRDAPPRPDHLRRGGAPAPGLRGPHRRPVRRATTGARPRRTGDGQRRRRAPLPTLDLRRRRDDLADQPRLAPAPEPRAARLRARHRARLLGAGTTQAAVDDPDDPMSDAQQARHPVRRGPPQLPARRAGRSRSTPSRWRRLQAALKRAIQVEFQLEDQELAAEPLPTADARNVLLFYEAAEGGAGRAAPARSTSRTRSREVARAALRALPLRPGHRRRTSSAPRTRTRGLRGRLLRLPAQLRQPARPPAARPPRDPRPAARAAPARRRASRRRRAAPTSTSQRLRRRCDSELERRFARLPRRAAAAGCPTTPRSSIDGARRRPDFVYDDAPRRRLRRRPAPRLRRRQSSATPQATRASRTLGCDGRPLPPRATTGPRSLDAVPERLRRRGARAMTLRRRVARPRRAAASGSCCPDSTTTSSSLRPLGGTDDEIAGHPHRARGGRAGDVRPARPDRRSATPARARLLRDALRLGFRSSAGPFRSLRPASPSSRAPTSSCRC